MLLLFFAMSLAGAAQLSAQIWINPLTAAGSKGTYYRGDALGDWWVQNEIGQASWNSSQIGIGLNTDGSTGWNFADAYWYQDGSGSNKRVQRNLNGYRFTETGNYFIIHRAKANSGDAWTASSAPGWMNSTTYPPSNMNTGSGTYFAVNALPSPTSVSLSGQTTSAVTVNWTRAVGSATTTYTYDTIVVRHTAAITDPTQGTTYNPGGSPTDTGAGTVVYKGNANTFTDTGLSPGTSYYYKVYAENYSYYSASVSTNSATIPSAPATPTASSVATTSFTANWIAPSGGATTSYYLDVATDSGFTSFVSGYNNKSVAATSASVTGLTAGTAYYVRVRAVSAGGTSASSSTLTQITVPDAPATPSASSVGTTSFSVSWSAVTGASSYKLDVATDSSFSSKLSSYNDLTATSPTTVSSLSAGTTYYVRVRAVNSAGTSASSSTLTQATSAASAAISSSGAPGALSTTYGTASSSTTFSVSGANMAAGILVTPPSGFQVSTDNSTFSSTVTVGSSGTIASTTVYVRLAAATVPGTYSGNIVLSSSGASNVNVATTSSTVDKKALTMSNAAVTAKTYDRTTAATITGTLSGVVGSDTVTLSGTGTFASANVGTGIAVTSTSTIGGANASYYTLSQPTGLTGNITAAPLTVTGASATNKTYDRTTAITVSGGSLSGVISGDTVTLGGTPTGSVSTAAVGTGKAVTVTGYTIGGANAGNYALTQPSLAVNITAKALTVTGASATNRDYDGTTTVAVSGGSLSGVISGDTVTLGGTPSGSIASATVGTGKAVTVTGYSISGADSGNYSLTQPTGLTVDITKATPTITAAPTASGIKYPLTLASSTLSGGTASVAGSFSWTTSATIPTPGTASYPVTFTPTDTTNYNTASANASVTSTIAQARNTGGAVTANQPSTIYLGDTNKTFGVETWGTIDGAWGAPRLFVRYNNSDLTGGIASAQGAFTNVDAKTINSLQFTNTGTWYWGIQMDYGATYGTNFWYKTSSSGWADMSTSGSNATLSVTVSALPDPSSVSFSSTATDRTTIGWTAAAAGGNTYQTIVVRHTGSITDLTQGTTYAANSSTAGGTVVYKGFATNFTDTGLTPGTTYYYKVYSENYNYYSTGVATNVTTTGTPSITIGGNTSATASAFTTTYGTASSAQQFTIAGSSLTADIKATAPTGFEVSKDGTTYGTTATFTQTGGSASGTLYVRLAATAAANGTYNSQNITLESTGATTRNITTASSGNTVSKATPSITAAPTASAVYKGARLDFSVLTGGTASVAGNFAFTSAGSTILTATGSQGVTFTPTDTTNYNTASTSVTVTVNAVPDPSTVSAASGGTNSITLTHTRTDGINVMIVRKQGSAVTFTPSNATAYTDGQDVGSGNVVFKGTLGANSSSDTGLTPGTTYHYKIFSEYYGYYSAGVTASASTDALPPTISTSGTAAAMSANYGSASVASTFTASGANLTAGITVTAPAGFEVSTSSGSGYAASVSLTPSSGSVGSTTIYVRLKANAAVGANSGNVTLSSTGATSQNVAVSGTVSVPSMSMTISSPAGTMDADYTTSKLFADELAGTTNNVTITFNTGNSNAADVEVWTNLNNRDRADDDANSDGIPDGIVPPDPPTDKPEGYSSGAYPSNGYFQAHPMSGSGGTYTLTLNANKTGAYRLTARYRVNGGEWVWYNFGGKRDHAITVTPVVARNMNVYEVNVLNVNATGSTFETRSTFESLTNSANGRVNLDYLRNLGVNTVWFQPIHPNGIEGRQYDPGSPYAVKNFFEVMEQMSQGNSRAASMAAFTNFVAAADTKGVSVMLDAPFNHTALDAELAQKGVELLGAAGVSTNGWSASDKIKDREARFFSRNDGANAYSGPASSAANIAPAPDRTDFGKWNDVIDVFFGRYSALVTGNPDNDTSRATANSTADAINLDDLRGTGGVNATNAAVTRAVWQYFASYVPYWLEKTGLPAGSSLADQAVKGIDGLRADFGQGMPPQFWEYAINVARERKWSFVFMTESLDGGQVTFRSNRHFDVLNENIVPNWQTAATTTAHRSIFEDRRNGGATVNYNAGYGQGLVLLNNTSHDEVGYSDPWQAFVRYAVGSTIDGAPMIMYGQEIGTGAGSGENSGSFDWFELNFGKWIPQFKRYNSMQKQWDAWSANSLGVKNLMPAYSGVGLAREFSPALRSSNRYFLNPLNSANADERIFAVAKYETANAAPSSRDVVLAFVNLTRSSNVTNTFGIPSELGTLLGLDPNKLYNVRNIAAYLGPNNEYPNRRNQFLWNTPRSGGDILTNGIYVALNGVPATDEGWVTNPHEPQYLKVYAAPVITTSNAPGALSTTHGLASTNTSFTFSATDVHDGVTVTAPSGFYVSTNSSTGFTNSLALTNTGTIGSTTLYVRLAETNAVGTYSGDITLSSAGGNSTTVATASSTVGKAVPSITTAPTASAITYGQALSASSLSGGAASVAGSFAFTTPATAPNAGTADQSVTFTPTDSASYGTVTLNVSVTVNKATPTITKAPTASTIIYGQTLASSTLSGGTASTAGTFAFTDPTVVPNAGTASQSVTFTPADAVNFNTAATSASVTVNAASLPAVSFTAPSSLVYDGSGKIYSASATGPSSVTLTYTGRNGTTYNSTTAPTSAGDYTVTATTGDANYSGSDAVNFSITAKELTGSFTAANKTYDGTTSAAVTGRSVAGAVSGDDVNHTGGTATFASKSVGSGKTVTLTGATLTGAAAGNYTLSSMNTTTANITAKALTIGSPNLTKSKVYDGTMIAAVTAGSLTGVESGDSVTVSAAAAYDTAAAGTGKTITLTYTLGGASAGNYAAPASIEVTDGVITPKALSITGPTLASRAYDGTTMPGALTVGTLSGLVGSQTLTVSGSASNYPSMNVGTYTGIAVTYTLGNGTNGGLAANYSLEAGSATGIVTPGSVSSGDITLTRDGDNWSASASGVSGFAVTYSGRSANGITTSYGPSASAPTAAGYYTVTAISSDTNFSGTKAENYFVTGPVAAPDQVVRPAGNASFSIPQATLLENDKRIDASGNVQTSSLSVSAVSPAGGNQASLSGVMVNFTAAGSGVETFAYTLTDTASNKSAATTVTVTPQASAESFAIAGTPGVPMFDGDMTTVTMTFSGTPNVTYYIYYKGELSDAQWIPVGGVYSENGTFTVEISEDGNHVSDWTGSMFFRGVR